MKSGFVAILGQANVGKSTLLNAILREKVSIVSPKPQTTRNNIIGIYNDDESQIVFTDTPGMLAPKNKLGHHMKRAIVDAVTEVERQCALRISVKYTLMSARQSLSAQES